MKHLDEEKSNIENNPEPSPEGMFASMEDSQEPPLTEESILAEKDSRKNFILFSTIVPIILIVFFLISFTNNSIFSDENKSDNIVDFQESRPDENIKNVGNVNILSDADLSEGLKDTVYTNLDCWLELRPDEQMLYQHWRDGRTEKYPVTSGNKYLSKGVEARPGIFAIFYKNPHHKSVQFNDAALYHFMTFNQGIGFHSLAGTGYYQYLGVRPVSHGCIRMTHEDARKLFSDCPMGTLVLVHRGYTSRTVAFAPEGFKNDREYSKEEYKLMLAENLLNVLEGKYYIKDRYYFVVDPKIIPVSGIYISYDRQIPNKQILPNNSFRITIKIDRVKVSKKEMQEIMDSAQAFVELSLNSFFFYPGEEDTDVENIAVSSEDLIKKYFYNPIGILPYFPPTNKGPSMDDIGDIGSDGTDAVESTSEETSTPTETVPETPSSDDGGLEE